MNRTLLDESFLLKGRTECSCALPKSNVTSTPTSRGTTCAPHPPRIPLARHSCQTARGAFYPWLAYRVGKAKGITATAAKLAILLYRTLKGDLVYQDSGAAVYDIHQRTHILRRLRQRAESLGFSPVNREAGELLEGAAS